MNASEKIAQLKKLLFGEQTPPTPTPDQKGEPTPAPAKMTKEVKTVDGKTLVVDDLAVGANVLLDGAAAADGEYTLEDGSKLQVAGGQIVELSSKTEDLIPEETMAKFAAELTALKVEFGTHKEAFAATQSELATQKQAFAQLLEVVSALSNQPTQPPIQQPAKSFSEMTPLERFRASKSN